MKLEVEDNRMPNAYNKLYLEDAMDNLGSMFDYVINILKIDKDKFNNMFMESKIEFGHIEITSDKEKLNQIFN